MLSVDRCWGMPIGVTVLQGGNVAINLEKKKGMIKGAFMNDVGQIRQVLSPFLPCHALYPRPYAVLTQNALSPPPSLRDGRAT